MAFVGQEGAISGVNRVNGSGDVREIAKEPADVFLRKVASNDDDGGILEW